MRYFNDYIRSPAQEHRTVLRKSLNRVDITKKDEEEKQYVFGWAKIAVDREMEIS